MKICWYGNYWKNYSRNIILQKAMTKLGYEIKEFHCENIQHIKELKKVLKEKGCDILFIGFPAYRSVFFGKWLSIIKKVPTIYDPLISRYNTYVEDKKKHMKLYEKWVQYYEDKAIYSMADYITLDTYEHIKYFISKYNLHPQKFERILLGTDTDLFYPREEKSDRKDKKDKIIIKFHGFYNPLQGIPYIVKAAHILKSQNVKDIEIHLLGNEEGYKGKGYKEIIEYINKYKLQDIVKMHYTRIPYEKLPQYIQEADITLGIFGNTIKANMVVPNKVYENLAMGKPVITQRSPAINEVGIRHQKHAYLVEGGNPQAIADAILELKEDDNMREKLSKNAWKITQERFSIENISKEVKNVVDKVVK